MEEAKSSEFRRRGNTWKPQLRSAHCRCKKMLLLVHKVSPHSLFTPIQHCVPSLRPRANVVVLAASPRLRMAGLDVTERELVIAAATEAGEAASTTTFARGRGEGAT